MCRVKLLNLMKSKTGIRYLNLGHHFWTLVIGELWYDSELEKKSALRKPDEVIDLVDTVLCVFDYAFRQLKEGTLAMTSVPLSCTTPRHPLILLKCPL